MSIQGNDGFLDLENASLRVTGNVHAEGLKVGSVRLQSAATLQSTTVSGNTTTQMVQFTNPTKGFDVTSNIEVGDANLYVDTTTGRVGVGTNAPMGTLDVKGVLNHTQVANVAQITSNSNVVMEYKLSTRDYETEEPRIALTANSDRGYVASASSVLDTTRQPWEAFNGLYGDDVDGWFSQSGYSGTNSAYNGSVQLSSTTSLGEWIKLELPHKLTMTYIKIHASGSTRTVHAPEDFKMYGSNDDINWTEVLSETGAAPTIAGSIYNADTTTTAYKYFALVTTRLVSTTSHCDIGELELYGTPLTANVATGTDVVLHTTPNVPKTDFSNVYYDGQDYTSMPATVADKSGNGVTGTPSGGVGFDTTYKAFTFDGVDDKITATLTNPAGAWVHSTSMWWRQDSSPSTDWNYIYQIGAIATNAGALFAIHSDGFIAASSYASDQVKYDFVPVIGKWYHFSVVYRGGNYNKQSIDIYVNGSNVGGYDNDTSNIPLNLGANTTLTLGAKTDGTSLVHGSMANFRLYNQALSADEIWELYAYQKEYFGVSPDVMTLKAGRLGIGTSEPRAVLDVRGDIRGGCPAFMTAYSKVNTTVAGGGAGNTIIFESVLVDKGNGYNPSTGHYTFPIDGYYEVLLRGINGNDSGSIHIYMYRNGSEQTPNNYTRAYNGASGTYKPVIIHYIDYYTAGETIHAQVLGGNFNRNAYNSFSVKYLSS